MEDFEQIGTSLGRGPQWYALYTRHQHEKVVANILTNRRFEVFLPLYTALHSWKDRKKHLLMPLFPCYVFVRGGLERKLDIVTTPGVHSFVACGGHPAVIPTEQIDAVRRATENSLRIEPHPFLKTGDHVRVKAGPLEGAEGILVRKKNMYRLVISVELLGSSAAVEVDAFSVERVPTPIAPLAARGQQSHESMYPNSNFRRVTT
jgi:transcription antitermination factor NusG